MFILVSRFSNHNKVAFVMRVLTTGIFDLFHVGHLHALQKAKAYGDCLIVGVSADEDAASYKRTPIIPFEQRIELLQAIRCVDEVVVCPICIDEAFYKLHRIDLHCQGDEPAGCKFYEAGHRLGILRIVGREPMIDSSQIIASIQNRSYFRDFDLSRRND